MKTTRQLIEKSLMVLVLMVAFSMVFSCSNEINSEPEGVPEALNAKSNNSILKTLVKGAALQAANGLDVGLDGNLYVASVNGQEIAVINKNNGKFIDRYGPANGVLGPDDLVFGPDGTLYWTDILTGFVGRMTADGQQLGYQFVAPGVNPVRFSDDGRLFVALGRSHFTTLRRRFLCAR